MSMQNLEYKKQAIQHIQMTIRVRPADCHLDLHQRFIETAICFMYSVTEVQIPETYIQKNKLYCWITSTAVQLPFIKKL
jgi:hypothetical protein